MLLDYIYKFLLVGSALVLPTTVLLYSYWHATRAEWWKLLGLKGVNETEDDLTWSRRVVVCCCSTRCSRVCNDGVRNWGLTDGDAAHVPILNVLVGQWCSLGSGITVSEGCYLLSFIQYLLTGLLLNSSRGSLSVACSQGYNDVYVHLLCSDFFETKSVWLWN